MCNPFLLPTKAFRDVYKDVIAPAVHLVRLMHAHDHVRLGCIVVTD